MTALTTYASTPAEEAARLGLAYHPAAPRIPRSRKYPQRLPVTETGEPALTPAAVAAIVDLIEQEAQ